MATRLYSRRDLCGLPALEKVAISPLLVFDKLYRDEEGVSLGEGRMSKVECAGVWIQLVKARAATVAM